MTKEDIKKAICELAGVDYNNCPFKQCERKYTTCYPTTLCKHNDKPTLDILVKAMLTINRNCLNNESDWYIEMDVNGFMVNRVEDPYKLFEHHSKNEQQALQKAVEYIIQEQSK
jgi:hypothetical protein